MIGQCRSLRWSRDTFLIKLRLYYDYSKIMLAQLHTKCIFHDFFFPKMLVFQIVTICPLSLPSRSSRCPRIKPPLSKPKAPLITSRSFLHPCHLMNIKKIYNGGWIGLYFPKQGRTKLLARIWVQEKILN